MGKWVGKFHVRLTSHNKTEIDQTDVASFIVTESFWDGH